MIYENIKYHFKYCSIFVLKYMKWCPLKNYLFALKMYKSLPAGVVLECLRAIDERILNFTFAYSFAAKGSDLLKKSFKNSLEQLLNLKILKSWTEHPRDIRWVVGYYGIACFRPFFQSSLDFTNYLLFSLLSIVGYNKRSQSKAQPNSTI